MATRTANTRLAREYKVIRENPPEFIVAHPSEQNILEWHYILTGPPATPYDGGQYWGTLTFPTNYPFAPPAIRMHTPSGRFQPSSRLCLSISDFHPRSFNPAWGISTILVGLLSFMTGEEMTTGSVAASAAERRRLASRSRWWNSTGGGSSTTATTTTTTTTAGAGRSNAGVIRAGDGGARFRAEWADLDRENRLRMVAQRIDLTTGNVLPLPPPPPPPPAPSAGAAGASSSSSASAPPGTGTTSTSTSSANNTSSSSSASSTTTTTTTTANTSACAPMASALRHRPSGSGPSTAAGPGAAVNAAGSEHDPAMAALAPRHMALRGLVVEWVSRHRWLVGVALVFGYVVVTRLTVAGESPSSAVV
ncbi:MAG: Ubiquitin-conjugating enzyme E2 6 [Phylliscum demangeonii]|nr:MAG: Ubiquitin-conjugating enzyme E2 6 [Phylliscum demangeonii]